MTCPFCDLPEGERCGFCGAVEAFERQANGPVPKHLLEALTQQYRPKATAWGAQISRLLTDGKLRDDE